MRADNGHVLPDDPLATEADVRTWLHDFDKLGAVALQATPAGLSAAEPSDYVPAGTAEWLSVVSDFRTETTRGVTPEVLGGLTDVPQVLSQNITLEIDRLPYRNRSTTYRNERSGISELRRMVNRTIGEERAYGARVDALEAAAANARLFLDWELCPNLRTAFGHAWRTALERSAEAVRIGRVDPMELPYAPPQTVLPSYDYEFRRLGDVWKAQKYGLTTVHRWLDALDAALAPGRIAYDQHVAAAPPLIGGPTRCGHMTGGYMTWAAISVPPRPNARGRRSAAGR